MATNTNCVNLVAGVTLAVASFWNAPAFAAAPPPVPATLQQQGRILDSDGAPVSSKVHFVFSVYAKAAGGAALWTEEQDVTLDDGYFSTELGSKTALPADLFDGSSLFLGVTVGNDDEMAPRQTISSVPYALLAGAAVTVPFTGISGVPAACADGKYLKGFATDGVAVCGTLPALSCHTVVGTAVSAASSFVGCPAGEVPTGGGCVTDGALKSAYLVPPCSGKGCTLCGVTSGACGNEYMCVATTTATITPSVRCCSIL